MKIELQSRDFQIKKINTKQGEAEICELKPQIAFDPDFINEMRLIGVKDKPIFTEEEEEIEE